MAFMSFWFSERDVVVWKMGIGIALNATQIYFAEVWKIVSLALDKKQIIIKYFPTC